MSAYKRTIDDNHTLALMLEHSGGPVAFINLSAFAPGVHERLIVTGERAVIQVDSLIRLTYVRQAEGVPDEQANARVTHVWTPEFSLPDTENDVNVLQGYATELIAFADAIREGHEVSPSIDDGVAAMKLVEAVIEAPDGLSLCEVE
jgi:predicted dehydrogenase